MTGKIVDRMPNEQLQQDLEKYRKKALELGATDARLITTDMILIDERVRAKCLNPKCNNYGTNVNCPPYTPDLEQTRKIVNSYHCGIFTMIHTPCKVTAGQSEDDKKARRRARLKNHEMVGKLEAEAFYDGYYLALGLADGPCKLLYCPDIECEALTAGQACRQPLRSRASLEGWGMDAYRMAASVGWDIYPIGGSTPEDGVPCGTMLGLVLIY